MESFVSQPKCSSGRLDNIEEDRPGSWKPLTCAPPETPTETMEFLARSWSLSALELSKALTHKHPPSTAPGNVPFSSPEEEVADINSTTSSNKNVALQSKLSSELFQQLPLLESSNESPPPMESEDTKLYKTVQRGKTVGRWLKDQKERKKQEIRFHNAQLHGAMSVAGVAAAVAVIAAATATATSPPAQCDEPSKISAAVASAAALVASHCVEIAEEMGADHDQILTIVNSAVNVRTAGDVMTLTAAAATALRGASILKARLQRGCRMTVLAASEEQAEGGKELDMSSELDFALKGGELLKRTRKGSLHWKQVSFHMNSNWQVVVKMKSKCMVGTFTKRKKSKQKYFNY